MSFSLSAVSVFSVKNSFLTDSSAFHSSIFSVILMIQFSASSEALFSDLSESAFSVLSFAISSSVSALLISFLVSMSMCFQCLKILRIDISIQCIRSNKYVKCTHCLARKAVCLTVNSFLKHKLFTADNSKFLSSFFSNCYKFKS